MQKILHKSVLICLLTVLLVVMAIFPAPAKKTTEQKIDETEKAIEQLQEKTQKAKEELDAAKSRQSAVGAKLDELNTQLKNVQQAIENVEGQITRKNDQIAKTRDELNEMEAVRAQRYDAMKARIRFMYEHSDSSMLDSFLGSRSMSEFLNRVEYFSQVVAYDREQLTEYRELLSGLEEKQQQLDGEKDELLALQKQQQEQMEQLTVLVADTREKLKHAGAQKAEAQDALYDLEAQLKEQEDYQNVLEAQLAYEEQLEAQKAAEDRARMEEIRRQEEELRLLREEEARRRAEEEEQRRLEEEERKRQEEEQAKAEESGETVTEPDPGSSTESSYETSQPASAQELEILACIIQCEAEGEPYIGKLAVGSVVLNRVASPSFPNTIMGVIYQDGQFSPVASGRMAARVAAGANSECRQAAQEVLNGNITVPYLYFRRDNGTIDGYVIAHHVFY
ncbi:MAG: cell wall hydrolase [Lachnospiraceae bacterium]|nr:cell wall hydrolase [bacterium]MDY5517227.1 cell wall hydrolase [Lachnospiraceae bacterium]